LDSIGGSDEGAADRGEAADRDVVSRDAGLAGLFTAAASSVLTR
jgi:hypothetical protein